MFEVEAALQSSDLNCAKVLHDHNFLVLCNQGGPAAAPINNIWGLTLFTSYDSLGEFLVQEPWLNIRTPKPIKLAGLAELLGDRVDFDALFIDPYREPRIDPWPPSSLVDLRAGLDPRPESRILRARTIAELHLFLDQENMIRIDRKHQLEYANCNGEEKLVAHYRGTVLGRRAKSYRFEPVVPSTEPLSLGDGPTELLCLGFILEQVSHRLTWLSDPSFQDPAVFRGLAQETLYLAKELSKSMEGKTEFARKSLRTVQGAAFVRSEYQLANISWIASALKKAEQLAGSE